MSSGRVSLGLALALAVVLAACGDDDGPSAPPDGGAADTGGQDAGPPPEDGSPSDAAPDAQPDTGPPERPLGEPDSYCPGGPDCPDEGDGVLQVGVARAVITPTLTDTTDVQTVDTNGDGEFDPADGDEFDDRNGNGIYDGIWIAGFGNGRGARSVHDDQWVRAVALRRDATTVVLVTIDCVGYFKDEMDQIREMVAGEDVDYVAFGASHVHEARDTLGIWGVTTDSTGIDDGYMATIRAQAARAIREAVADLRPANVQYARYRLNDMPGGMLRYVSDGRDPYIIDDEVRLLRFTEAGTDTTIATLLNWGSHPEYWGSRNTALSSDYVHWLREALENGVVGPDGALEPGLGGTAVFFQGALGSQIGPGEVEQQAWDGTPIERRTMASPQTAGEQVAYFALRALRGGDVVTDETARLGFRNRSFFVDVQNRGYHIALLNSLFQRQTYNWDPEGALVPGVNEPDVLSEVAVIDIGRAQIITAPGELDPALFLGGYDGSRTPDGREVVDTSRENPPDLSRAPAGPYLRDLAREDAEYVFLFGLTNDMLGYFVLEFDYQLHPTNPYLDEAPGEHYEETNSAGIDAWPKIRRELEALLAWRPDGG